MSDPKPEFEIMGQKIGTGTIAGAAIGGFGAVTALFSGAFKEMGWLRWLIVPITAALGGLTGDYIAKDGPVFGPVSPPKRPKNPDTATIPEGYIAAGPNAYTYAVDSATLSKTGDIHWWNIKSPHFEDRPLDDHVEFNIKGDPRVEDPQNGLRKKSHEYKEKFQHIADPRQREKEIVKAIVKDVGDTYGEWSGETMANYNAEERKAIEEGRTAYLSKTDKGGVVCRHQAGVVADLLHGLGIKCYVMSSYVGKVRQTEDGQGIERVNSQTPDINGHMFVWLPGNNVIVEPTVAGKDYASQYVYRPVLNNVTTIEEFVLEGKPFIVETGQDRTAIYGGHDGKGTEGVKEAQLKAIDAYNVQLKKQKDVEKALKEFKSIVNDKIDDAKRIIPFLNGSAKPPEKIPLSID